MRIGPFGVWEILIILIVVLLIFGPRRLPEMAKGLGQSVRAFRKEMRDIKADLDLDDTASSRPASPKAPGGRAAESSPPAPPPAAAPAASDEAPSAAADEPGAPRTDDQAATEQAATDRQRPVETGDTPPS